MSTISSKRARSIDTKSISPPPVQRRRKETSPKPRHDPLPRSVGTTIRIFSWNVNGAGALIQKQISFHPGATTPLRGFLKRHQYPQFLCLQEVKIAGKDDASQRQLQQAANSGKSDGDPVYAAHFSLPRDKYNATGFGGKVHGVATLIRDDMEPLVKVTRKVDWDLEGRVLISELRNGLAIINAYWVNGTSNPYRDPATGQEAGSRHDHKLRFHQHMLEESQKLEADKFDVILIGDMNIARSRIDGHPNLRTSPIQHVKNRADFNDKFFDDENGFNGVDIFREIHGEVKRYTYYGRGVPWGSSCDRVDLIVLSQKLVGQKDVDIETDICDNQLDRGHSDHVPLWVSVSLPDSKIESPKPQAVAAPD